MNTGEAKERLLQKEQELLAEISRLEDEARESRTSEVEDPIDQVTSSELKAANFQASTLASKTLLAVREALQRIDDGTYGTCIACGRPIEPARLNAVPWTPYCLADQEQQDKISQMDAEASSAL